MSNKEILDLIKDKLSITIDNAGNLGNHSKVKVILWLGDDEISSDYCYIKEVTE